MTPMSKRCLGLVNDFLTSDASLPLSQLSQEMIPPEIIDRHSKLSTPSTYPGMFDSGLHRATQEAVALTVENFREVFKFWKLEELSMSYNGGKDCEVQLIIYLAIIEELFGLSCTDGAVKGCYVHTENEFDEQMEFLQTSVQEFDLEFVGVYTKEASQSHVLSEGPHLKVVTSSTSTLMGGFKRYLEECPQVKAIIVGIRQTDPWGSNLQLQMKTDTYKGWPDFTRINPILHWKTAQIWYFLKWVELKWPHFKYCKLYDMGFTSIGGRNTTIRNPQLRRSNDKYWPAWWVCNDESERLSRI